MNIYIYHNLNIENGYSLVSVDLSNATERKNFNNLTHKEILSTLEEYLLNYMDRDIEVRILTPILFQVNTSGILTDIFKLLFKYKQNWIKFLKNCEIKDFKILIDEDFTIKHGLEIIKIDGKLLQYFDYQTEEMQEEALRQDLKYKKYFK